MRWCQIYSRFYILNFRLGRHLKKLLLEVIDEQSENPPTNETNETMIQELENMLQRDMFLLLNAYSGEKNEQLLDLLVLQAILRGVWPT